MVLGNAAARADMNQANPPAPRGGAGAEAAAADDAPLSGRMVQLTTVDNGSFELSVEAASLSGLLRDTPGVSRSSTGDDGEDEAMPQDDDDDDADAPPLVTIELSRVGRVCLGKVVDFLQHHYQEPMDPIPVPLNAGTFEEVSLHKIYREADRRKRAHRSFPTLLVLVVILCLLIYSL